MLNFQCTLRLWFLSATFSVYMFILVLVIWPGETDLVAVLLSIMLIALLYFCVLALYIFPQVCIMFFIYCTDGSIVPPLNLWESPTPQALSNFFFICATGWTTHNHAKALFRNVYVSEYLQNYIINSPGICCKVLLCKAVTGHGYHIVTWMYTYVLRYTFIHVLLLFLRHPVIRHRGFAQFKKAKSALRFLKSAKMRAKKDQKARKCAIPC